MACAFVLLAVVSGLDAQQASESPAKNDSTIRLFTSQHSIDGQKCWLTLGLAFAYSHGRRQAGSDRVGISHAAATARACAGRYQRQHGRDPAELNWGSGLRAAAFAVDATPLESPVSLGTFNERDKFGKFETRQEVGKELMTLLQESRITERRFTRR